jgi:iron-sulfur cluster repair protein YtfE (RIC family)
MDAIQFLIQEHEKVRRTLADIDSESYREPAKKKMFEELCHDLIRHEKMEHQIWYPRFKDNEKVDDTVRHLISEEKNAERAIKAFDSVTSESEWDIKFTKFKKDVEHHANEEEKNLFPLIKRLLTEDELVEIGKQMHEFKQQYNS